MLKPTTNITDKEQLLAALIASLKLFFVALSFIVLFAVLFIKALVGLGMVLLQAGNLFLGYLIHLVASVDEVQSFAHFLITAVR